MKLSNTTKSQITKIFWITLAWTFFSLLKPLEAYDVIHKIGFDVEKMDILTILVRNTFSGILAGLLGGSYIVFIWEKWLRNKPYGWVLRNIFFSYTIIFLIVAIPNGVLRQSSILNKSLMDLTVWNLGLQKVFSITTLVPFFSWLVIVILTVIALQVNDKYGPGVFRKFLLGRYFIPQKEERIFMFLDLRSSTSIAEKLGEEKYFSFLKDVFKFSTPWILKNKGEIYQYVGDEIIINWKLDSGLQDSNCIQCFFAVQAALNKQRKYFKEHYGNHPEFKAGIHYGHVMVGEIGIVKREIAFSGDVLNTTARIQAECNEHKVNVLLSKKLLDCLDLKQGFKPNEIGSMRLRGKEQQVTLYSIFSEN